MSQSIKQDKSDLKNHKNLDIQFEEEILESKLDQIPKTRKKSSSSKNLDEVGSSEKKHLREFKERTTHKKSSKSQLSGSREQPKAPNESDIEFSKKAPPGSSLLYPMVS